MSTYVKGKGWRLAYYADKLRLHGVEFKVSQSGRLRALQEGKRNVHAFAYGTLMPYSELSKCYWLVRHIKYNPFKAMYFYTVGDMLPVHGAQEVTLCTEEGVWAWGIIH